MVIPPSPKLDLIGKPTPSSARELEHKLRGEATIAPRRGRKMYRLGVYGNINIAGEGEHPCECTLAFLSIGKSRARRGGRAQGRQEKGCPDV